MITSTGHPIDVAGITDFNIATIIKDPSVDLTDVSLKLPPETDWAAIWADVFTGIGGTFMTLFIIGAVVAGLWLFAKVGGLFKGVVKGIKKLVRGK